MPIAIPFAEQAPDGVLNLFDLTAYQTRYDAPGYEVLADWDLNGARDFFDFTGYQTAYLSTPSVGRGILSNYGHRFGYAGYWYVPERGLYHVRNRWYDPENGRWLTRDRLSYIDGSSLYQYTGGHPNTMVDPSGNFGLAGALVGGAIGVVGEVAGGIKKGSHWSTIAKKALVSGVVGAATGAVGGMATKAALKARTAAAKALGIGINADF